jgi:hypothetical protein
MPVRRRSGGGVLVANVGHLDRPMQALELSNDSRTSGPVL